jgi:hypothetical protein
MILKEMNEISGYIFELKLKYAANLLMIDQGYFKQMRKHYYLQLKEKWGFSIFRDSNFIVEHFSDNIAPKSGKMHKNIVIFLK